MDAVAERPGQASAAGRGTSCPQPLKAFHGFGFHFIFPKMRNFRRKAMTPSDLPAPLVLQQLIQSFLVTQCIYVAARLGIVDLLNDGPRSDDELAKATGTHAPSLYRVLRVLAAVDLLTEEKAHSFALTPLGAYLRAGVPGSVRAMALAYGAEPFWPVWGALLHSVETGEPSFEHVFGLKAWDYYAQHPVEAAIFNTFMTELTASVAPAVAAAHDFSPYHTLADIGGGHGQMLASILQAYPTLHGVLFDLPHVVQGALPVLEAAGIADRCQVSGGDIFAAVPAGYDAYLLSRVIQDWDDERAIVILTRCYAAMNPQGKIFLVERVIPTTSAPELHSLESDVIMLVGPGGKQRTEAEYHALLKAAGFALTRLIPVLAPYYLIEAVKA
jgi:hypothetical protein